MLSSCRPDTENQQALTICNGGIDALVTHKAPPAITIRQMCRAAPCVFSIGNFPPAPSMTLEDWAASQPATLQAQLLAEAVRVATA